MTAEHFMHGGGLMGLGFEGIKSNIAGMTRLPKVYAGLATVACRVPVVS
jgi:hypothetical protein